MAPSYMGKERYVDSEGRVFDFASDGTKYEVGSPYGKYTMGYDSYKSEIKKAKVELKNLDTVRKKKILKKVNKIPKGKPTINDLIKAFPLIEKLEAINDYDDLPF